MSRIKKEEELGQSFLDAAVPFFSWLFRISLIISVLTLGYLLYAMLVIKVANPAQNQITRDGFATIVGNLKLVGLACTLSTGVFALSITIAYFHVKDLILYMGAVGALFHFGMPFLFARLIVSQNGQGNDATDAILGSLTSAGKFVLVVAVLRGIIAAIDWIRMGPTIKKPTVGVEQREKASVVKQRKMTALSPCWQLPYCRDSIKEKCPAFIAKRRCWKFGRGCYCDEEMIQAIVRGMDGGNADSYSRQATTGIAPKRKKPEGKPPCGKCYIYLEHQRLKHKLLSNFMLPLAILLCIGIWKPYCAVYEVAMVHGRQLWNQFAFKGKVAEHNGPGRFDDWQKAGDDSTGQRMIERREQEQAKKFELWQKVFVMAMVAVFILVYISKALEFIIFRLHW
jgi:hypothetical protein